MNKKLHRRDFVKTTVAASAAFTIIPRNVLGKGFIPPSDKINIAYVGCGTQGLREMCELIIKPEIQITSVCDPNKFSTNYLDWSPNGIRDGIRKVLENPNWGANYQGIPGGRDIAKDLIDTYYSKKNAAGYKACTSYIDFRELFEKEKNFEQVVLLWYLLY